MRLSPHPRSVALACTLLFAGGALLGACSSTTPTTTTGAPGGSTTAAPLTSGTTAMTYPGTTPMTYPGTTPGTSKTDGTMVGGAVEIKIISTPFGPALGNGDGLVLYAWDQETGSDAKCVAAACVQKWPPFVATSFTVGTGVDKSLFGLVDRPDGTKQVTVGGKRLYRMSADTPGDANCQGLEGWYIRNADGSSLKNTVGTTTVKK